MGSEANNLRHSFNTTSSEHNYGQQRYKSNRIEIWITSLFYYPDLQNVSITLRILHRPDPAKLPTIYNTIGTDYAERILPSITNEILKAVVVS
jgi:hypothetical protein